MGELEDLLWCTIKHDLVKIIFNISQPDLINKMTQGFNEDLKSIINFNTPATPHKDIVQNQQTVTTYQTIYIRDTGVE